MTNGTMLRQIRIANRFSITDLSQRSGITRAQISLIENDKADPRLSTLLRYLAACGADLSDLRASSAERDSLEEVRRRAARAAVVLDKTGLGPSDPELRLDRKQSLGFDTSRERDSLATRK